MPKYDTRKHTSTWGKNYIGPFPKTLNPQPNLYGAYAQLLKSSIPTGVGPFPNTSVIHKTVLSPNRLNPSPTVKVVQPVPIAGGNRTYPLSPIPDPQFPLPHASYSCKEHMSNSHSIV
ncbi:uncharacterized protein EAF02_007575 [Botrytis sinoallii]|uniref:uncharacterized protein n=1 Tax=Botrytis sinoallii TaxID=1463999 RepID=UPI00190215E9|nr:uncharacterized protein EAF02_007575 [Botrytis sinoallii]KAF7879938.1 hypothetical protein EAF02_007575 [Botrytis sinoallii]